MTALLLLGPAGAGLVVLALVTARRPPQAPADLDAYLDAWQLLHGGYDPRTRSSALRRWLTVVHAVSRPVARRGVQPDVLTLWSLWLSALVVGLAQAGGRWVIAAGVVLVVSGLADNLDGCVAVLEDRTTRWGFVLDSVVDRASDCLYLVAAVAVGCPVWLAVSCGFACLLMEYLRARAGNAGGDGIGRVTMAERPTRVILIAGALVFSGVFPALADRLPELGVGALLVMTAAATVQLAVAVRGQLAGLPPA